jgi:hypothetical protein
MANAAFQTANEDTGAPYNGRPGCGVSRVTGLEAQVNAQVAYTPLRSYVIFVTLW